MNLNRPLFLPALHPLCDLSLDHPSSLRPRSLDPPSLSRLAPNPLTFVHLVLCRMGRAEAEGPRVSFAAVPSVSRVHARVKWTRVGDGDKEVRAWAPVQREAETVHWDSS